MGHIVCKTGISVPFTCFKPDYLTTDVYRLNNDVYLRHCIFLQGARGNMVSYITLRYLKRNWCKRKSRVQYNNSQERKLCERYRHYARKRGHEDLSLSCKELEVGLKDNNKCICDPVTVRAG